MSRYFAYIVLTFYLFLLSPSLAQRYEVTHLGGQVNTVGSETGAVVMDDTVLIFSSHGIGDHDYMQLWMATVDTLGRVSHGRNCPWPVNNRHSHTGNAAYDARHDRLFYTRCEADDTGAIQCALWMAQRRNGRWQRGRRMGGDVNLPGTTSTHPTVGYQADGSTLLYFVSDRSGGMGGLDIWYVVVRDDAVGSSVNLGAPVNGDADELTPFYDTLTHTLYFSSDRKGGLGGYDIYHSSGARDAWQHPSPLPTPMNSAYNDLYFSIGAANGQWGFLASNREDSFFEYDSSCCNDLYRWRLYPTETLPAPDPSTVAPLAPPAHSELKSPAIVAARREQSPITLYFHNDQPDAGSWSDTTEVTYFQTYNRYMFRRGEYLSATADSVARQRVNGFFEEARDNCDRFERLMEYMLDDLEAGRAVEITLRGYASTPHSGDYNGHLSARRIACVINQLYAWRRGVLSRFLSDGRLQVQVVSFGSRHAETAGGGVDPVFSVEMARERRVEIVDYQCR